jgi:glutamine amidotransferase
MMQVAVVDPGSGNLASVLRALRRAADEGGSNATITVETQADAVAKADAIVMPGQGAFAACRRGLDAMPGMVEAVDEAVTRRGIPFLGICVGMQLMVQRGLEHGTTPGLGWIAGDMAPMDPRDLTGDALPLPQMGWNGLRFAPGCHPVLEGIEPRRPRLFRPFLRAGRWQAGGDPGHRRLWRPGRCRHRAGQRQCSVPSSMWRKASSSACGCWPTSWPGVREVSCL